ncbi:right-handed parallel beta-helix repeat-containing protein [Neorhizobium lilium]|uniref:Right-handed parallel beta-helix repeat-containing protein n=1 Tax=Neorhizobium lilium TaxID=2503024 RepID=A0A3S4UM27_9HYPH|nr:right-handed parallel beta-helix repeat-containing protein [Neorhizobium lilium]RWX76768.1 right-handed parallel beta-helix repeat-containing protein [Neorhizobium lilium]
MRPYVAVVASMLLVALFDARLADAAPCHPQIYQQLRQQSSPGASQVEIACDLALDPGETITASIVLSGSAASDTVVDCRGAVLAKPSRNAPTVLIRSVERPDGSWDVPVGVGIRNCTIKGDLNIRGLGRNGEAEKVRLSSLSEGHTARAQAAAPRNVTLSNITFEGEADIPLYAAPGVTGMTVENSRFTGRTVSTVIYLDAESARNRIIGNVFDIHATRRELIAVDGSADNRIEGNRFDNPLTGGIFLYRNCGEGGTIRHQSPQRNVIADNVFHYSAFWAARPAIWLGSRQGSRFYCLFRSGIPLGSSLSPYDFAQYNTVTGNRMVGATDHLILDSDEHNTVRDNF